MDVYLFHDGKSGFSVRLPTAENGNSLGLAQNNCANMFIGVAHPCGSARGKHGVLLTSHFFYLVEHRDGLRQGRVSGPKQPARGCRYPIKIFLTRESWAPRYAKNCGPRAI